MHATAWLERLAEHAGEPRDRLLAALEELGDDAATVFTELPGEEQLVAAGVIAEQMTALDAAWRASITPTFVRLGLPMPPPAMSPDRGRTDHSDAFRWLHGEFTSVRRQEPVATW
jgi:1,2-phenylacetyl-CoA epoxidase catalytic subunit